MKKYLKIRDKEDDFAYVEGNKIYTKELPEPIVIIEELEDGSYFGWYNCNDVYFKKTPWGDYYTSILKKNINPLCYCSNELDTVFYLISRNANTSIILSCLYAEGVDVENYSNEKLLWHDKELMEYCKANDRLKPISDVDFSKFSNHVVVLDDPIKRWIRVVNKIYTDDSLVRFVKEFKNTENMSRFLDEIIYYADACENDYKFLWERHLGLQSTYIDKGAKYNDEWQIVKLEELPKWYENTYGKKWLRNNVAKERPISRESFNDEQWEKVLKFLERDFEFLKTVDVLLTTGER
jgi:hypothetical protein